MTETRPRYRVPKTTTQPTTRPRCHLPGCPNPVYTAGLCWTHRREALRRARARNLLAGSSELPPEACEPGGWLERQTDAILAGRA
jgi:hypothetical protein